MLARHLRAARLAIPSKPALFRPTSFAARTITTDAASSTVDKASIPDVGALFSFRIALDAN